MLGDDFVGRALVNNVEVPLTTPLRQGDAVLTLRKVVLNQNASVKAEPVVETPVKVSETEPVSVPVRVTESAPVFSVPVTIVEAVPKAEPVVQIARDTASSNEEPTSEKVEVSAPVRRELSIFFNDQPLFLPGKESGEPYFLMDLLEYSGIDFKKLDRRVRMEVNGEECGFQTALQQGDHVLIRPE